MLREAINRSGQSPQQFAANINYSRDAVYKACQGNRKIPADARKSVAQLNIFGALAVAYEQTEVDLFMPFPGDKHPQAVIQRLSKEDCEADAAFKDIAWKLLDKTEGDLTDEDRNCLKNVVQEGKDEVRAWLQFFIMAEQMGIMVLEKKKTAAAAR